MARLYHDARTEITALAASLLRYAAITDFAAAATMYQPVLVEWGSVEDGAGAAAVEACPAFAEVLAFDNDDDEATPVAA